MERIEIKEGNVTYKFKSFDGKLFDNEDDCIIYENSSVTKLKSRLNIVTSDAWKMFFGEDYNTVEIVNGERIDILKYICLQPIYTNVSKLEALDNVLNEQYNEDFIAIYNAVGNMFKGLWKKQYIERMNNEINEARKQKENKQ